MPHHEHIEIEGLITDIFAHRFVVELSTGQKVLADLGPKGADSFVLKTGARIIASGEMKPSELKVERIARKGEPTITIEHKKKHGLEAHDHADPSVVTRAVTQAGFEPIGAPRRKPKHFEILARKGHDLVECHVEFDGHIRKEKPIDPTDEKWSSEIRRVA